MKLPANVGQKKAKGLEQMLQDMGMGKLFIIQIMNCSDCFVSL